MMGNFDILHRIVGSAKIKTSIVNQFIYRDNEKSFAGNSLEGSNVLIVTNYLKSSDEIYDLKQMLDIEGCNSCFLHIDLNYFNISEIEKCAGEYIGAFEHIINFIDMDLLLNNKVLSIYKCLQIEANYIIEKVEVGSICVGLSYDSEINKDWLIELYTISNFINGLGNVMANHSIIVNGVTAERKVPIKDVVASMIFLCSKYGQILAGAVFRMSI